MYAKFFIQTFLFSSLGHALVPLARSIGGSCDGVSGICVATGDCTDKGGSYVDDKCPNDPYNIKCCTNNKCGPDKNGRCQFTSSSCSGTYISNYCPGADDFKCCVPDGSSGGPYPIPNFPSTSSGCKSTAIAGAKAIVKEFPGKIKEIGCIRSCSDPSSSDHCTGMATDMMVALGGIIWPPLNRCCC